MTTGRFLRILLVVAFWASLGVVGWRWVPGLLEADEKAVSKAQAVQDAIAEHIARGTATPRNVEEIIRQANPDHSHYSFEGGQFYWDSPFRSCLVIVRYEPTAIAEDDAKEVRERTPSMTAQPLQDHEVVSVLHLESLHPENEGLPLKTAL